MKVAVFGTALLACAIPAFGQADTTLQPSYPVLPANCQAALISPGVPSGVVVLTVPVLPSGEVIGAAQLPGSRSQTPLAHPGRVTRPASRPGGVVVGGGIGSGIGSMQSSGIGTMTSSGIGSMTSSGVGSIGTMGLGSIGTSSVGLPQSPVASSPFASPLTQSPAVGHPSMRPNAITQPLPGTVQRLPFFCP